MNKITKIITALLVTLLLVSAEYLPFFATYATGGVLTAEALVPLWSLPSNFSTPLQAKVTSHYVVIWNNSKIFNDVSSDENYLSVTNKSKAYIFDLFTGKLIGNVSGEGIFTLPSLSKVLSYSGKFSPNGKRLYCVDYVGYESSWNGTRNFIVDLSSGQKYYVNVQQFMGIAYSGADFTLGVMDYTGDHFVSLRYGGASTVTFGFNYWQLNYSSGTYDNLGGFGGDYWSGSAQAQVHVLSPNGTVFVRYSVWSNSVAFFKRFSNGTWTQTFSGLSGTSNIIADTSSFQILAFERGSTITIGYYSSGTFVTAFNKTFTPSDFGYSSGSISWSYPQTYYDWWNPSGRPSTLAFISAPITINSVNYYPAIVYVDGTIFKVNNAQGTAVGVSPDGRFVFLGRTLYLVSGKDPQSGNPRLRMIGYMYAEDKFIPDTSAPLVYVAPSKDWHAYFFNGNLLVKTLYSNPIPRQLITDNDILNGKLGNMLNRGLVSTNVMEKDYADVSSVSLTSQDITPTQEDIQKYGNIPPLTADRTILYMASQNLYWKGYLWDSHVTSGVTVKIPLNAPISPYSNLTLSSSFGVLSLALTTDSSGNLVWATLLGMGVGNIFGGAALEKIGTYIVTKYGSIVVNSLAKNIGVNLAETAGASLLTRLSAVSGGVFHSLSSEYGLTTIAGTAFSVVGAVLIVDGLADIAFATVTPPSNKLFYVTFPVFVDTVTGNTYTAVMFVVPQSEAGEVTSFYYPLVQQYAKQNGLTLSGYQVIFMGSDRNEYMQLIASGAKPTISLLDLAKIVSNAQNIPLNRLQLKEVDVAVDVRTTGRCGLVQTFLGGVRNPISIGVFGQSFRVEGTVASFSSSDPSTIANTLGKAVINGQNYTFVPTSKGAMVNFSFPEGANALSIKLPDGYSAVVNLNASIIVKKDFSAVGNFGYNVSLHYDWDVLIRLTRIEFIDMPYPMNYSERTFLFREGNFTHEMSKYFTLTSKVADNSSPTGWRYTYVSTDPRLFDPANGGMLQPCKTFKVNYYYKSPPDVAISILLNGTSITSSLARHASLIFTSSVAQPVNYLVSFRVIYNKGLTKVYVMNESFTGSTNVGANGTAVVTYIIDKYVSQAVAIEKNNNTVAYVEIYGKITYAPYDFVKSNDEATVTYIPSPQLWSLYGKNVTLKVFAYNMLNLSALSGVTVTVFNATKSFTKQTLANGTAVFYVSTGLYNITAKKDGYLNYSTTFYVYNSTSLNIPMVPSTLTTMHYYNPTNGTYPPIVVNGTNYVFLWTSVYWQDGAPFEGALVKITDLTHSKVYSAKTNGTGTVTMLLPVGINIKLEVNATNPKNTAQTFYGVKQFTLSNHTWMTFKVPWTSSYFAPEVMIQSLRIYTHRGQGYFYGNVSHLVVITLWTNVKQTITVFMKVVDASTNSTLSSKTLTYNLQPGVFVNFTWFSLNASKGLYIRAFANITQYQNDTDTRNNALWSNVEFLKPFVNFRVYAFLKVVNTKIPTAWLPEDQIEVDIEAVIPINTTVIPATLSYAINSRNIRSLSFEKKLSKNESIVALQPGVIWRNFTITLPWTDELELNISIAHPWQDVYGNNMINFTIPLGALIKLQSINVSGIAGTIREGSEFTINVNLETNIPSQYGRQASVHVYDNTTSKLLGTAFVSLAPNVTVSFKATAPSNPNLLSTQTSLQLIPYPVTQHTATAFIAGYADYIENNNYVFTFYVWSTQFVMLLLVIIIAILLIMAIVWIARKTIFHTIEEETEKRMKFVKKKPSENKFVHKVEEERTEPKHFVHEVEHKEDQTSSESKKKGKFVRLKQVVEEGKKKFVKKKEQ